MEPGNFEVYVKEANDAKIDPILHIASMIGLVLIGLHIAAFQPSILNIFNDLAFKKRTKETETEPAQLAQHLQKPEKKSSKVKN